MPLISLDNENKINEIIKNIEKNPIQSVLSYNEFDINIGIYSVDFNISGYRELELLEMGILKFLSLRFKTLENSIYGISDMIGIDEIFLKKPLEKLKDAKLIEDQENILKITNEGEKFFLERRAPIPLTKNTVKFIYNSFTEEILRFIEDNQDESLGELLKGDKVLELDFIKDYEINKISIPEVKEDDINKISRSSKMKINSKKQKISNISNIELLEERLNRYLILYVYDHLDKRIYLRVWDYITEKFSNKILESLKLKADYSIEEKLESYIQKRAIESPVLNQLEAKYSESLQTLINQKENKQKEIKDTEYNQLPIKQVRNEKIKPEFNKVLKQTKKLIIISTPWIAENVVNKQMFEQFQAILNRGGKIVISWGYADRFDLEEKLPPKDLIDKLNALKSKDGSDGVLLVWIGNKHNKEIIVDNMVHMLGSFNWLSYKGEYNIRGESVYKVEEKSMVEEASEFLEESILDAINNKLNLDKLDIIIRFKSKDKIQKIFERNIDNYMERNFKELINFMERLLNKNIEFEEYFKIFFTRASEIKIENQLEEFKKFVNIIQLKDKQNLKKYIPKEFIKE